jgi:uncharacterized protein CbrC (UPF0167 family)
MDNESLAETPRSFEIPDRCCQCSQTENLHSYEGELYCQKHLNERLAQERM